jgi:hypothetical protein
MFLAVLGAHVAAADPSPVALKIVRTEPSRNFLLPRFGTIYMEVAYTSGLPLRLQAQGYKDGKPYEEGEAMNASVIHPAGSGRALVWVSYGEPAKIDEIRITAYDDRWKPLTALHFARPAQWLERTAGTRATRPDWVRALTARENAIAEEYRADHPAEMNASGALFFDLLFLSLPGYLVLQAAALLTFQGRWRKASMAALLVMVPAAAHAVLALAAGSNLWPLVLLFAAPFAFVYLVLLFAIRFLSRITRFA